MHDDRTAAGRADDRAAARIREASPAPDDATTERIAARIAAGAGARPASARRATRRRSMPLLRPALAGGAVAVALAIALLAPSGGDSGDEQGLLALGPDVAAADVLRAAGEQASDETWRPLSEGEYHYVRSTYETPDSQFARISERWTAADGTTVTRESIDGGSVAEGESFWMPASRCLPEPTRYAPPEPPSILDYRLPAGSAPPSCWQQGVHDPLLRAATGRVVDEPPSGAAIYLPDLVGGPTEDGATPRYGDELRESDATAPARDAGTDAPPAPTTGWQVGVPVTFPDQLPVATTWIEVRPEVVVAFETTVVPGSVTAELPVALASWPKAFTMAQLADLPTNAGDMVDALRLAADRITAPQAGNVRSMPAEEERWLRSETMIVLATELLATAPIPPEVRRAAFGALAELRAEREPTRVLRDVSLPDGRPAIGIRFDLVQPEGFEVPEHEDDHVVLLLDARTAQPVQQELVRGGTRDVVTWDTPRRVDSIE